MITSAKMPYKKRKRIPKKKYKKRKSNKIMTPYQGLLVAPRQLVKFKYKGTAQLNATTVAIASSAFRGNGMFDPDASAGGHSVLGYDEWSAFYNHYTVIGAKCTATFFPTGNNSTLDPQIVGLAITAGSAPVTANADSFLEQKYLKRAILTGSNSKGYATVTQNLSVKKFLGQNNIIDEDDNTGNFANNGPSDPSEQIYFQVFACPYSPFNDPNVVNVMVEIEYIALLHEPRQLIQS